MSNTPKLGLLEWDGPQNTPWLIENASRRIFEAFSLRTSVLDRDLTAPPVSCADGDRFLVKATATGDWAGHDGQLAVAKGANAINGWLFATVTTPGTYIYIADEGIEIYRTGIGTWVTTGAAGSLAALSDVDLSGLADGYVLRYDLSNGQWYPSPDGGGGGSGGGIDSGTSFPGTPADGDLFYRSDRDILYEYDGTYAGWLSVSTHTIPMGGGNSQYQATTNYIYAQPYSGLYGIRIIGFSCTTFNQTSPTSADYMEFQPINESGSTNIGTAVSTQNDGFSYVKHFNSPNVDIPSTDGIVTLQATRHGSGTCTMTAALVFRLIG